MPSLPTCKSWQGDAHLDILARLGEVFGDEELLRRLTTEGDPQVIYEALK